MSAITHLTLEQFRSEFGEHLKPYYEFWEGEAVQKAVPTKLHGLLQWLLAELLAELGLRSYTELSLRIDSTWEPIPDVIATLNPFPGPYPTTPVEIVAEILSPQDSFVMVEDKCERYASLGIAQILVFDPVNRKVWRWDRSLQSLILANELRLCGKLFDLKELWRRFDARL